MAFKKALNAAGNTDIATKALEQLNGAIKTVADSLNVLQSGTSGVNINADTQQATTQAENLTNSLEAVQNTAESASGAISDIGNTDVNTEPINDLTESLNDVDEFALQTVDDIDKLFDEIAQQREAQKPVELDVKISDSVDLTSFDSVENRIVELETEIDRLYIEWETQQKTLTEDTEEYEKVWAAINAQLRAAEKERGMLIVAQQNLQANASQQEAVQETAEATEQTNKTLRDYINTLKTAFNTRLSPVLSQGMADLEGHTWDVINTIRNAGNTFANFTTYTDRFRVSISTANDSLISFKNRIVSSIKSLIQHAKESKTAKSSLESLNNVFKRGIGIILKYGLGIRSTYILINKLRSAVKEGYKNLGGYSDEVNKSISSVLSALAKLKNQLAATFEPIVTAIVPLLNTLIAKLNEGAVAASQFFAAWTGQNYVYKAKDVQKKYVDELQNTAKAAKEVEKYLSPLDDLNIYKEPVSDVAETDKEAEDPKKMFEKVAVESEFLELVKKIKKELATLFEPIKSSWNKYGQDVTKKVKLTFESLLKTLKSVHDAFLTVWTGGIGESIVDNILQSFININDLITNISDNFRNAWDTGVGLSIIQKIADTFNVILDHVRNITKSTADWSKNVNFEPLLNSLDGILTPIQSIVDLAGQWTESVWNKIFLPLTKWAIEEGVPAALDAISGALSLIEAVGESAGKWLGLLWDDFLSPAANWVGEAIVDFLNTLGQVLKDVSENETAVSILTGIGIAVGSIAAAIIAVNAALTIMNIIASTNPFTWIIIAVVAVIAVIIELITYWDTLKDGAKMLGEWFKKWFTNIKEGFKQFVSEVKDYWTEHNPFPGITNSVKSFVNGFKKIISGITKFLFYAFKADWKNAWSGIKEAFVGIWQTLAGAITLPVNAVIDKINLFLRAITNGINSIINGISNAMQFEIPDFIPGIGGNSYKLYIPPLEIPTIPKLAAGAVIPPNREFMAVLGDQKSGTNIEAPVDLIRQVIREEMANVGGRYEIPIILGKREVTRLVIDGGKVIMSQTGRNPFELA